MKDFRFKKDLVTKIGHPHTGGNYILDKGLPSGLFSDYLNSLSDYVRMIKLGWTSWSLISNTELQKKVNTAKKYNIPVCLGGSLFEISYERGFYTELLAFIVDNGFKYIEIGSGFAVDAKDIPKAVKQAKKQGLNVVVEIGFKDQKRDDSLSIKDRMANIHSAVESGADHIILEAREQGEGYSVFKEDKSKNRKLLDSILHYLPLKQVIFEAPNRKSQVFLIKEVGPNVNLGNIPFDEIPRVETFRRRLHADTFILGEKVKK